MGHVGGKQDVRSAACRMPWHACSWRACHERVHSAEWGAEVYSLGVCVEAYALNQGRKHVGTSHPLRAILRGMRWCYEACGWRHADAVGGMRMRLEVVLRGMRMRLEALVRGMRLEVLV